MREEVERILGCPIPEHLDYILQRCIVQGKSAEQIAHYIKTAMTEYKR